MADQAAGLRQWASENGTKEPVVVLGIPDNADAGKQAGAVFERWAEQGKSWVGDPQRWQIIKVAPSYEKPERLIQQYRRWALWVDTDLDAFYNAYQALKALHQWQGPKQILALHPAMGSRKGLLTNLQQVAREYFDIQLLVFSD